jgi:hypothetical protein
MYRFSSCWNALGLPHCAGKVPSSWQAPRGTSYPLGSTPCDPSCKLIRAGNELLLPQDCGRVPLRNRLDRTSLPRSGNANEAPHAEGNAPAYRPYNQKLHCKIHGSTSHQTAPIISMMVIGCKLNLCRNTSCMSYWT